MDTNDAAQKFQRLLEVMDRLRSPGGCVWDARQTHESLVKYLIEETYEVVEVIESPGGAEANRDDFVEELGDVLLQVIFHSRVAQERSAADGGFTVADVVDSITEKLVRRHPQVFDAVDVEDSGHGVSDRVLHARWEEMKKQEKPQRTGPFDGLPPGLPALQYAEKVLTRAQRHGMEPEGLTPAGGALCADEQALGQQLFDLVRQAVAADLDPERALRGAIRQYTQRV